MSDSRSFRIALVLGLTMAAGAQAEEGAVGEVFEAEEVEEREAIIEDTSVGEAVSETAAPGWTYPKAYAARPLTMDKYMLRGTFSIDVKKIGWLSVAGINRTIVALDFGAAFTPLDNLEVGITNYRLGSTPPKAGQGLIPIIASPSGDWGDMPIYGRYSFLHKDYFEIAADLVLVLPSNTNFAATFGFPMRIRARGSLTVDTGAEITVLTNGAGANIELPVKVTFNITTEGFIFGESGFSFQNLGRNSIGGITSSGVADSNVAFPVDNDQVFMPFALGGGYTLVIKGKVMMDFYGRFGWHPFVYLNPPTGVNAVPAGDAWFLGFGTVIYTKPLIKKNQS